MYPLSNTYNLQSNLSSTLHPFKTDEVMISATKEEAKNNATGAEVTVLGMNPITATIVGVVLFLGIGVGTLLLLNHHSK